MWSTALSFKLALANADAIELLVSILPILSMMPLMSDRAYLS